MKSAVICYLCSIIEKKLLHFSGISLSDVFTLLKYPWKGPEKFQFFFRFYTPWNWMKTCEIILKKNVKIMSFDNYGLIIFHNRCWQNQRQHMCNKKYVKLLNQALQSWMKLDSQMAQIKIHSKESNHNKYTNNITPPIRTKCKNLR